MTDEMHYVIDMSHVEALLSENEAVILLFQEPSLFVQEALTYQEPVDMMHTYRRDIYDREDYELSMMLWDALCDAVDTVFRLRDSREYPMMDTVQPIRTGLYRGIVYAND